MPNQASFSNEAKSLFHKISPNQYFIPFIYWTPRFTITDEPMFNLVINTVSVSTAQVKSPFALHWRSFVVMIPKTSKNISINQLFFRVYFELVDLFQVMIYIMLLFITKKKKNQHLPYIGDSEMPAVCVVPLITITSPSVAWSQKPGEVEIVRIRRPVARGEKLNSRSSILFVD